MTSNTFKALVVEETDQGFIRNIKKQKIEDLPDNDLLIKVEYSSLNYKDALSASGNKGVTRHYPHTPGIDAAGTIVQSKTDKFLENQEVIVTSYDLGMNTAGGFGQYIRVPSEWAVKLPDGLTMKEAMILGTAGLTAGMSVLRLTESVEPGHGPVAVSGATGGVGALGVSILAKLGYDVCAISGKQKEQDFLLELGAKEVLLRSEFETEEKRPMLKGRFSGCLDTVGGTILENLIKSVESMGVVTCCGNVASPFFNISVFPFILRGVSLIGIDSQHYPMKYREKVWNLLAGDWKPEKLMEIYTEVSIEQINHRIDMMLNGELKGRTILKHGLD